MLPFDTFHCLQTPHGIILWFIGFHRESYFPMPLISIWWSVGVVAAVLIYILQIIPMNRNNDWWWRKKPMVFVFAIFNLLFWKYHINLNSGLGSIYRSAQSQCWQNIQLSARRACFGIVATFKSSRNHNIDISTSKLKLISICFGKSHICHEPSNGAYPIIIDWKLISNSGILRSRKMVQI